MRIFTFLSTLALALGAEAQTFTYTNTDAGENQIPLGYEVPIPVDSLTPVDGFRTYQSLHLRHVQMAAETDFIRQIEIGVTTNGLSIYSYAIGDGDSEIIGGGEEASALINGGIHAREWQTPEAATGYIEYLFDNHTDQHLAQYLIENLELHVIPVLNVDGFLQTQRFATQVTNSQATPRDGRMRRKNMLNVDQDLQTTADNLNGVDLNRNNSPFWATSQSSSSNRSSLVHHGDGPASEPETQALQQAAVEAGESRLRLYTDNHSFTQVYFAPYTGNSRRDAITDSIALIMRSANDMKYRYDPSSAGAGIGSTDEYFANTYQIPSYTLEIEPRNSGAEYGGFGPSHSGFILPNSEVSRMRSETTRATMSGLYAIADIPFLMRLEVWDEPKDNQVLVYEWQKGQQTRTLEVLTVGELQANTNYHMRLIFNKPMRDIQDGQVVSFSTLSGALGIEMQWLGSAGDQNLSSSIDSAQGSWLIENGFHQYKSDTFEVPFSLPDTFVWQELTLLALQLDTTDMTGQGVDTNPATIVDWQDGAWTFYEDTQGLLTTDAGGIDRSFRLIDDGSDLYSNDQPEPPSPTPSPVPQPPSDSGGGGSIGSLLILLALMHFRQVIKKVS